MADLRGFDANKVEPAAAFDPIPAGKYLAMITASEMKPNKAGTGRFLGVAAQVLELSLDDLGPISLKAQRPVDISSTCTVFAETEILSYLAQKKKLEDILMGMHKAIAARTVSLLQRVGMNEELTFTGGVSRNAGMVVALQEAFEMPLNVSEESQYIGAIGAAIFALERAAVAA